MTRVEKYREYRKEILNSFYVEKSDSNKTRVSEKVSEATLNKDTTNNLSVEEVLEAYELYEQKEDVSKKNNSLSKNDKKRILFFAITIFIAVVLVVALIIVGIFAFGGK